MNVRKAISRANDQRMNVISDEQKYAWIYELDAKLADEFGVDIKENPFPEDAELLVPYPYDNIYELYLVAMIDYYNQESNLYANDMEMFNASLSEARAGWIRSHRPEKNENWRVM